MTTPIANWPSFSTEEADAVREVVLSNKVNYWTGQEGRHFEQEFAQWSGAAHAIAVTNGTVALDLALKAAGIGPGDEVIVTPRTFIASVSSVITCGATPVFADVDRDSGNISPATIEPVLTNRTRAIIPVHLAGWPCDMSGIMEIAEKYDLFVIEDCAQAHGAKISSRSVGTIGHVGAWSFCQDKIMTTGGEGGMVTTNDQDMWDVMWSYKDHGKNWDAVYNRNHPPGFRYVHESFGTNWRMLEVQSAVGRIQLGRMPEWTARRNEIAASIAGTLSKHSDIVRVPVPGKGMTHAYYRLYAYVNHDALAEGWDRDRIVHELMQHGLPIMHGTCSEVYLEKAFDDTKLRPQERLPNARELGETSVMFLINPNMESSQIEATCSAIDDVLTAAAA